MQAVNASYSGLDQRRAPRIDVYARLPATLPDGRQTIVTVVNLSADGALVRIDGSLPVDAAMILNLPVLGRRDGRTIWSVGGRTGVSFDEQISAEDFLALVKGLGARVPD